MKKAILFLITLLCWVPWIGAKPVMAQGGATVTELLRSGDNGVKRDLVIIGDGFQANQQNNYNNFVEAFVRQGVFGRDVFAETANAFNIYRINVDSVDAGVTQVDANGNVTIQRNTALDMRYSGNWNRCWMEWGPNTQTQLDNLLNSLVPQRDYVFVVLNDPGVGGCAGGNMLTVTTAGNFTIGLHEMGHMVGGLGDEYFGTGTYTGGEPGAVNLTTNTDRATIKWREFIDPATPIPTTCTAVTDQSQDVGLFAGATLGQSQFNMGLFRPHCNDRMNGNTPPFGPVNYNQIHKVVDPALEYTYDDAYAGDFNGDGRDDVVVHNANSLALYRSTGDNLELAWINTGGIADWQFTDGDRFLVADFDGDGRDDLFVLNLYNWSIPYLGMLRSTGAGFVVASRYDQVLPGWDTMMGNDQFFVADFNGDGKDDLYIFNGQDFSMGYLAMLSSTGTELGFIRRFDDVLPGWGQMKAHDRFFVANFDGDTTEDLYVFNGEDWSMGYLEMLRSSGNDLQYMARYDNELPGWGAMKKHDQFFVADFDYDSLDDLYVFNGHDWSMGYLEMLRSDGSSLANAHRFDGSVAGWDALKPNDRFFVADVDGNGRDDLYVFNADDWVTEYLGVLRSSGNDLSGSWQDDWISHWNLGTVDRFLVGNFSGGNDWQDLFVRNRDWFGLFRSHQTSVQLNAIHPWWIHNHRYHSLGWW